MERAKFRGKEKVHMQFLLTASAINLKKIVKMLEANGLKQSLLRSISCFYQFVKDINVKRIIIPVFLRA
jgi:methanogenic corrinoid protein MtbC1